MDIDFLIYNPPSCSKSRIDLWGQLIHIPLFNNSPSTSVDTQSSIFNCFKSKPKEKTLFSDDADIVPLEDSKVTNREQVKTENYLKPRPTEVIEPPSQEIPCKFLLSGVQSQYLLIYLHASGQDIVNSHNLLDHLRLSFQINVLAMEYPGYSVYEGSKDTKRIQSNALYVYQFVTKKMGFSQKNVIIMGRSIGTAFACILAAKFDPGALVLVSPFTSIKQVAGDMIGSWVERFIEQKFDNLIQIRKVRCPVLVIHGEKDETIKSVHGKRMVANCINAKDVKYHYPKEMEHNSFDYYQDVSQPMRQFLLKNGFTLYKQGMKGPTIPSALFKL